ncbi:MAG TPA: hypothetical protein VEH07_06330 [Alphaproteobacteria bacterium]|nr:hypothetical protein [Alphaproteobacteria bacterium]
MIGSLFEILPLAQQLPSWEGVAITLAMAGAGLCLVLRDHPRLSQLFAGAIWALLVLVVVLALHGHLPAASTPIASLDGDPHSMLVATGISIIGAFAWLLGGCAAIDESRRKWLAPLTFTLAASAIGTITASDLLVLAMWQFALGANVIGLALVIEGPGRSGELSSLLSIEAVCLICAAGALAILGIGLPADARSMGFVAMGLALLLILFAARLVSLIVVLPLIARARGAALTIEIAMIGLAIPAALHPFIALAEALRTLLPTWFVLLLSILASMLLIGGAGIAVGARTRGWRIASLAASLIGLGILGACEASKTALLFILLWLGPMPAFLAASSIAGRIEKERPSFASHAERPHADAINILLALACLAVIGLPPFAGFWARLILVQAAWGSSDYAVIAVALLSSLVLGLALARRAFERQGQAAGSARRNRAPEIALRELLVLGITSGLTLAGGLYPAPFIIISDASGGRNHIHSELTVHK